MNVKPFSLAAGAGSLLLAGAAFGDFTGLSIEHHATWNAHDVYRLYANFSGVGLVDFWGGDGIDEAFIITNDVAAVGDKAGSGFFQTELAGSIMPQADGPLYQFAPDEFDNSTYMTLGVGAGWTPGQVGDVFALTPGFNPVVNGAVSWGGTGGILSEPGAPNTIAVDGRLLLGQFTVLIGEHVSGANIRLAGQQPGAGAGGLVPFQVDGLSFTTIPAPGALALLGLAGLAGARRRRA